MRFLCISDIHGQADRLEKVLQEGRLRGYQQLVCCGDLIFPGPNPLDTWKILLDEKALCLQGLSDKAVASVDPNSISPADEEQKQRLDLLCDVQHALGELIVARLARLKPEARLPLESGHEMLVLHGSPTDPTEAMSIEMSDEELNALIGDEPADLIVCGGSHVPFERQVGDTRIVNVGSVGESPTEGIANATLIESSPMGVSVDQFHVEL